MVGLPPLPPPFPSPGAGPLVIVVGGGVAEVGGSEAGGADGEETNDPETGCEPWLPPEPPRAHSQTMMGSASGRPI